MSKKYIENSGYSLIGKYKPVQSLYSGEEEALRFKGFLRLRLMVGIYLAGAYYRNFTAFGWLIS